MIIGGKSKECNTVKKNHPRPYMLESRNNMNESVNIKENVVGSGGGLTAEQKARISSKFRAAKALLARKRPLHDCSTTSLDKYAFLYSISN